MAEITVIRNNLPALAQSDAVLQQARSAVELSRQIFRAKLLHEQDVVLPALRAQIETANPEQLASSLAALRAPASEDEIAVQLSMLIASFPNAQRADLEAFGQILAFDVFEAAPSSVGLERACRRLRHTCRFIPTISEVLTAIGEEEQQIRGMAQVVIRLPALISEAKIALIEAEASRARRQEIEERLRLRSLAQKLAADPNLACSDADRAGGEEFLRSARAERASAAERDRPAELRECRKSILHGDFVGFYPDDIVAEATRLITSHAPVSPAERRQRERLGLL